MLDQLPILDLTDEVYSVAQGLVGSGLLPVKYFDDALHIATATVNGMDYLLTWNMKHIANASMRNKYEPILRKLGYEVPVVCTPEELM
jgi:hypothetical protein